MRTTLPLLIGRDEITPEKLIAFNRRLFGDARMEEGSGDGGGSDQGDGEGGSGGDDGGSRADAYTPPKSQADLDRIIQDRVRRATAKYADYDAIKEKADKHDALEDELASDKDKAVKAARDEERGNGNLKAVRAEFRAEAKGVLSDEQREALLEDLDLSKYVTDRGEPDLDKIEKKVRAFAPTNDDGNGRRQQHRDLGQGNRRQAGEKPGDQGRAMAQKRFGTKAS